MPNNSLYGIPCGAAAEATGRIPKAGDACTKTSLSTAAIQPTQSGGPPLLLGAAIELYLSWKQWRDRRRTLRALANLDERLLRDIGVTRGETSQWWLLSKDRQELAKLDDRELIRLSDHGRQRRRAVRHVGSDEWR